MTADLGVANAGFIFDCPQSLFDDQPEVLRVIEAAERREGSTAPYRIHRMPIWQPSAWTELVSTDRPRDFVLWERRTLQPKYAIPYHACYTLTQGTSELFDYWFFFAPFGRKLDERRERLFKLRPGDELIYYPRRGYDLWNTKYFVLPLLLHNDQDRGVYSFVPETEVVAPAALRPGATEKLSPRWARDEDWQVLRNRRAWPRAWVVHDARFHAPITGMSKLDRQPMMEEILYEADEFWNSPERLLFDPRLLAWIETDTPAALRAFVPGGPTGGDEAPRIRRYEPQRVEIDVQLARPGLLILADVYYPGWVLTVDDRPAPILRANRLMRGVALEGGRHHLVFRYQPASVRQGAALSLLGLLALLGTCFWCARQPRPHDDKPVIRGYPGSLVLAPKGRK